MKLAPKPQPRIPYALLRKAARMFKGSYGPRSERHKNIVKWILAVERLGDKHILKNSAPVKWGVKVNGLRQG